MIKSNLQICKILKYKSTYNIAEYLQRKIKTNNKFDIKCNKYNYTK